MTYEQEIQSQKQESIEKKKRENNLYKKIKKYKYKSPKQEDNDLHNDSLFDDMS